MHFIERDDGDFRIYTGAIETPRGNAYLAAVVIHRVRGCGAPQEIYRDESLCAGYGWHTPDAALAFAMRKAQGVIRAKQSPRPSVAALPDVATAAFASGGNVGRRRPPTAPSPDGAVRTGRSHRAEVVSP